MIAQICRMNYTRTVRRRSRVNKILSQSKMDDELTSWVEKSSSSWRKLCMRDQGAVCVTRWLVNVKKSLINAENAEETMADWHPLQKNPIFLSHMTIAISNQFQYWLVCIVWEYQWCFSYKDVSNRAAIPGIETNARLESQKPDAWIRHFNKSSQLSFQIRNLQGDLQIVVQKNQGNLWLPAKVCACNSKVLDTFRAFRRKNIENSQN